MEYVFFALAVLITLSLFLKVSFFPKWGIGAVALGFAVWIGVLTPWLTDLSKPQLMSMLERRDYLQNLSLALIIEAVLMIAYCMSCFASENLSRGRIWGLKLLRSYPGLMFGVVQGYVVGISLFMWPGLDFTILRIGAAGASLLLVSLGAWGLKWLLPEKSLRWELLFILNIFIILLSVVAGGKV